MFVCMYVCMYVFIQQANISNQNDYHKGGNLFLHNKIGRNNSSDTEIFFKTSSFVVYFSDEWHGWRSSFSDVRLGHGQALLTIHMWCYNALTGLYVCRFGWSNCRSQWNVLMDISFRYCVFLQTFFLIFVLHLSSFPRHFRDPQPDCWDHAKLSTLTSLQKAWRRPPPQSISQGVKYSYRQIQPIIPIKEYMTSSVGESNCMWNVKMLSMRIRLHCKKVSLLALTMILF